MKRNCQNESVHNRFVIVYGELLSVVKDLIESEKADLVVMGTRGSSGLQEILIGSNTEKIVRHVRVPVLSVPVGVKMQSVKNILLLTTLDIDHEIFMKKVREVQHFFNASLHLLYINTPAKFKTDLQAKKELNAFVRHHDLNDFTFHFKNYHSELEGVQQFFAEEKMDLVIMATHGRKGLAHLFNGSFAEDVVNHARLPVWTFRISE